MKFNNQIRINARKVSMMATSRRALHCLLRLLSRAVRWRLRRPLRRC